MSPATIRLMNWIDYLDPAIVARFEVDTGIRVEQVLCESEDECVRRITAGEAFDVVMADDLSAPRLRRANLLLPLDMDRLPNFRQVRNQRLRRPLHDPETDGHKYTSALYFGSEAFMARVDKVGQVRHSWDMLFDPAYAGQISMLDSAREALSAALYLVGGDANTTDPALIDKAVAMLVEQRPLVSSYEAVVPWQRTVDGVGLVHCWDGDVTQALKAGAPQVRYVLPSEGFTIWMDAPCIPASAHDPAAAHSLLDFLLDPAIAAANADFSGYQPVVADAAPLVKNLAQRALRLSEIQIEYATFHEDRSAYSHIYEAAFAKVKAG